MDMLLSSFLLACFFLVLFFIFYHNMLTEEVDIPTEEVDIPTEEVAGAVKKYTFAHPMRSIMAARQLFMKVQLKLHKSGDVGIYVTAYIEGVAVLPAKMAIEMEQEKIIKPRPELDLLGHIYEHIGEDEYFVYQSRFLLDRNDFDSICDNEMKGAYVSLDWEGAAVGHLDRPGRYYLCNDCEDCRFQKQCRALYNKAINRAKFQECAEMEGCFIATAVLGDYDHPIVLTLRSFRDQFLSVNQAGEKMIQNYYSWSPIAASIIKKNVLLKAISLIVFILPIYILASISMLAMKFYSDRF